MAATFLVTNTASLKKVLSLQRNSRVVIGSSRLGQIERRNVQERMNRWLGVSGYGFGLATAAAALVLCILWVGGHWGFFVVHWFRTIGVGLAACLFSGGLGRAIGLLYARWSLAWMIWSIGALMDDFGGNARGIGSRRAALLRRNVVAQ